MTYVSSMLMRVLAAVICLCLPLWGVSDAQAIYHQNLDAGSYEFIKKNGVVVQEAVQKSFEDILTSVDAQVNEVSPQCLDGGQYLMSNTDYRGIPLLLIMIDAIGKPAAGFLEGNIHASGAYDECFSTKHTQYCIATVNFNMIPNPGLPLGLQYGVCAPLECSVDDIGFIINSTLLVHVDSEDGMKCEDTQTPPFNAGAIIMIIVCAVFVSLVTMGTLVDWMVKLWRQKTLRSILTNSKPTQDDLEHSSEKQPLLGKEKAKKFQFCGIFEAFSLFNILPTILSTEQPPSVITSLNGLRVISMFWVILGHTHLTALLSVDNGLNLEHVMSRFTFQAVINAYPAVDTFFFLSGLLVAYLTLRQMARKNGRFPLIPYYLHRYLRLTPTYAFVLFFIWLLSMHLADGPYYPQTTWAGRSDLYNKCEKYWWTNLLYINNLYPWKLNDGCIEWTWYLANDMQFFVIAPLIIVPMYFLFPVGLAVAGVLLLISFIVSGTLAGVYDFQANSFAAYAYGYNTTNEAVHYNDLLYIKPWYRISPYLVGLVFGYLLYRKIRLPFHCLLNLILYIGMWIAAGVILMTTLYGLYFTWHGHTPHVAENVMYIMLSRFSWAVGLALVVFACHNGYGGVVNSFLSMKFWIPLSRLTYNAYLLHPMIVIVLLQSERKPVHYGDINMAAYAIAAVVLSYGAAAVVTVFVEFPLGNVEQLVFKLVGLGGGRESARLKGTYVRPIQSS